jgi:hypothetical protein
MHPPQTHRRVSTRGSEFRTSHQRPHHARNSQRCVSCALADARGDEPYVPARAALPCDFAELFLCPRCPDCACVRVLTRVVANNFWRRGVCWPAGAPSCVRAAAAGVEYLRQICFQAGRHRAASLRCVWRRVAAAKPPLLFRCVRVAASAGRLLLLPRVLLAGVGATTL